MHPPMLDAWAYLHLAALTPSVPSTRRTAALACRPPRSGCGDWACPKNRPDPTALRPWRRNRTNRPHDAKPTLAELAGVRSTDKPDEGERPKRDRPRLAFRPFHALMAILTLSCALCASLTMLVQQTIHYSELQHSRSQIRSQAQQQPQQAPQTEQTPAPQENGPTQDASTPDSHDGQDGAQQSNQLDLNTADLGELQTLKGVGPVTAQRILDYRTQIGRFDNVDQLLEVKGIGSKTLAKFRDQVCVR